MGQDNMCMNLYKLSSKINLTRKRGCRVSPALIEFIWNWSHSLKGIIKVSTISIMWWVESLVVRRRGLSPRLPMLACLNIGEMIWRWWIWWPWRISLVVEIWPIWVHWMDRVTAERVHGFALLHLQLIPTFSSMIIHSIGHWWVDSWCCWLLTHTFSQVILHILKIWLNQKRSIPDILHPRINGKTVINYKDSHVNFQKALNPCH